MANTTTTPNMTLVLPIVSQQSGPEYASNINTALTRLDAHTHAPGYGVPITPNAININTDLPFNNTNATLLRSTRYYINTVPLSVASSSADIACSYVAGSDLYFNDVSGNQIRITQNGGLAGSPGSISGLTSPASASYVSGNQTFVWQSDVNVAASMDVRNVILRNSAASSFGLTLQAPSMGANYTITLPTISSSSGFVTQDSSGTQAANVTVDNQTIDISAGLKLEVKDGGITQIKMGAVGLQVSSTTANFTTSSLTYTAIPGVNVTLSTTGRPVSISLQPGNIFTYGNLIGTKGSLKITRSGVDIYETDFSSTGYSFTGGIGSMTLNQFGITSWPSSSISCLDSPAAGTYNYQLFVKVSSSDATIQVTNTALLAYEI